MAKQTNLRYPKNLTTTELMSMKTATQMKIIDEESKEVTEKLKNSAFQLSGAFPYLFDGITMLCNQNPVRDDNKPVVERINNSLFYHATLTWEEFKYFAIGEYQKESKHTLIMELSKIQSKPPVKALAIGKGIVVKTVPIQIAIYKQDSKDTPKYMLNLKNRLPKENQEYDYDDESGGKIIGVELTFFGPLFEAAFKEIGGAFIQIGINFQAKLETAIKKYKESIEFLKYRKIKRYPTTYRKYALYLTEKDNGMGDYITISAKDMLSHVDPQQLDKNGNIRNITDAKIFVDKSNFLLNKMAKDGLLSGFKFAPTNSTYNQSTKEFIIGIQRESDKTDMENYIGIFTDEELKNINSKINLDSIHNAF